MAGTTPPTEADEATSWSAALQAAVHLLDAMKPTTTTLMLVGPLTSITPLAHEGCNKRQWLKMQQLAFNCHQRLRRRARLNWRRSRAANTTKVPRRRPQEVHIGKEKKERKATYSDAPLIATCKERQSRSAMLPFMRMRFLRAYT